MKTAEEPTAPAATRSAPTARHERPDAGRATPGGAAARALPRRLPPDPDAATLLRLQRTLGNGWVQRMIARDADASAGADSATPGAEEGAAPARGGGPPMRVSPAPVAVVQRQATGAAAERTYTMSLQIPGQTAEQYTALARDRAAETLRHFRNRIHALIEGGWEGHRHLTAVRNDQNIVGAVSDFLAAPLRGGISNPSLDIWTHPTNAIGHANRQLEAGDLEGAAASLQRAAQLWRECQNQVIAYREGTIGGAHVAEVVLEFTAVAGGVAATVATGGTAGIFVGAAYTAVQAGARQGTEMALGMRSTIDWAGITFDALFAVITAPLAGRLGNAVFGRLAGSNPAVASLGRRAVANIVSDVVTGPLFLTVHSAARAAFDTLRGAGQPITVAQFVHHLMRQILDPRNAARDIIMGAVYRRAGGRADAARAAARPPAGGSSAAAPPPAPARPRGGPASTTRGRLLGAAMRGVVESAPITGGSRGGPSDAFMEHAAHVGPAVAGQPATTPRPAAPEAAVPEAPRPAAAAEAPRPAPEAPAPAAEAARLSSGLELEHGTPQTTAPVHNEIDLPDAGGPALELAPGPQPERAVEHREFDWGTAAPLPASRRRAAPTFGAPTGENVGTGRGTGMHYRELNAAEVAYNVRVDYDRGAGRPTRVAFRIDGDVDARTAQSDRSFARSEAVEAAQPSDRGFTGSGFERGHLVQREAVRGDRDVERAADQWTAVVPMTSNLNRGAGSPWRVSETRAIDLARTHGHVNVVVEPIYAPNPPRLPDGTPIPRAIRRAILAPDGTVLEDITHLNQ